MHISSIFSKQNNLQRFSTFSKRFKFQWASTTWFIQLNNNTHRIFNFFKQQKQKINIYYCQWSGSFSAIKQHKAHNTANKLNRETIQFWNDLKLLYRSSFHTLQKYSSNCSSLKVIRNFGNLRDSRTTIDTIIVVAPSSNRHIINYKTAYYYNKGLCLSTEAVPEELCLPKLIKKM